MKNIKNNNESPNDLLDKINMDKLPKHIAIIMDGNGRWAKERLLPRTAGHKEGVERVKEIVKACGDIGIRYLTLYAFSTENWKRPKNEVDSLMKLLLHFLRKELNTLHKNNVQIKVIGDIDKLPPVQKKEILGAIDKTKENDKLILNIALNYGGRDEIINAVNNIIRDVKNNKLNDSEINFDIFEQYLYTNNQPDPDLLIRPSGELRISNFLLYQIAYSEFWFSNIYWPDFSKEYLYNAIIDYQNRDRRFGGVKGDK